MDEKQAGNDKRPPTFAELWAIAKPGDVIYCYGDKPPSIARGEAKEWSIPWDHIYEDEDYPPSDDN